MIGDFTKQLAGEITEQDRNFCIQKRALIHLDSKPILKDELPLDNPDLRFTDLLYYLLYRPALASKHKDSPYVLVSDLFVGKKIRIKGYLDLVGLKKSKKEIKWLLENFGITPQLFGIAKSHIELKIPIPFDAVKYSEKIRAQVNDKYLAVFRYTEKEEAERYRYKKWLEENGAKGVEL